MSTQQNHIMPFLWVHGEDEASYRKMVQVIDQANMKGFCVEARPHEEFCEDGWWRDLDIILDEAEKRNMKVWILDDKHFPTGYANGGALKAPNNWRRQSVCYKSIAIKTKTKVNIDLSKYFKPKTKFDMFGFIMDKIAGNAKYTFDDDALFSCTAYGDDKYLCLDGFVEDNLLKWNIEPGYHTIEICYLTRNIGMHRSYINMLEPQSCKILIDEVYEKHYQHYKDKFGTVIAGFFSDEPEIGNSYYLNKNNKLGQDCNLDLCWSESLNKALKKELGDDYGALLPLLWKNDFQSKLTAKVRYTFMDCVSRLVEQSFSKQIGEWCRSRNVDYIGHVIEDSNLHARTGSSLGHFFRGLKYQSMAGIDNIGGQVEPQMEDASGKFQMFFRRDGEFNHYALGKMGVSLAQINPIMNGNAMCEIFGNYGWSEGVRLEKYLVDHFMVRGINNFVPHAFTCKDFPDKDCPPHFYAQGNNPQYRHFGRLMSYTNRVCNMISGGRIDARVAVLYHGESEWAGDAMIMQKPARALYDNNVDFCFMPSDVFAEREFYNTKIDGALMAGLCKFNLVVVPQAQNITLEFANAIEQLLKNNVKVAFINGFPAGICSGEPLPNHISNCDVVPLDDLASYAIKLNLQQVKITPQTNRLRCLKYINEQSFYYIFNEDSVTFNGTIDIPEVCDIALYDAWSDKTYNLKYSKNSNSTTINIELEPSKSLFLMLGKSTTNELPNMPKHKTTLNNFNLSVCRAIDYPNFSQSKPIKNITGYEKTNKGFSGIIRYETEIDIKSAGQTVLEITDAYEGVEVFVNDISCGIQVVPKFIFDITKHIKAGKNSIKIEVATTLEREIKGKSKAPSGIIGAVNLYTEAI